MIGGNLMADRPKVCYGSCKNFLVNTERCIGCDRSKPYPRGRKNWEPEETTDSINRRTKPNE